jgi:hypothetical protein
LEFWYVFQPVVEDVVPVGVGVADGPAVPVGVAVGVADRAPVPVGVADGATLVLVGV